MVTHSSILGVENPMGRGAWWATVHRVTKSWTGLKRCGTHTARFMLVNQAFKIKLNFKIALM